MTSALTDRGSTRAWRERRAWWAQRLPQPCSRCGETVNPGDDWHLDHTTPRMLGGEDQDTWPAHARCNVVAGNQMRGELAKIGARFFHDQDGSSTPRLSETPLHGPDEPDPSPLAPDSLWNACAWLDELRNVPADGVWPRFMSGPHPRAVGSYGPEFSAWSRQRSGRELRWWQQLAAARMLEHDEAGWLVWLWVLLTVARQCGKSVLLGELALWRIHQAPRWGEPQLVLLTSKDLPAARELHQRGRAWARSRREDGYDVREANGQEEVFAPDGSRWSVRGAGSVYSYSASVGAVDECWAVEPKTVDDGIEPTTVEKTSPQLQLTSTAHRAATPLFPRRREAALLELAAPVDTLLLEWSAARGTDIGDAQTWRLASPHWSARRERLVRAKYAAAVAGAATDDPDEQDPVESFQSQWLNRWPGVRAARGGRDEPLVDEQAWDGAADLSVSAPGGLVVAVEDRTGLGAAAAAAGTLPDGRVLVWGAVFASRALALGWISLLSPSRMLVGASLAGDESLAELKIPVEKAGITETSAALPKLRELLAGGRLVHDGGAALASQVRSLRVVERGGGLAVSSRGRSDLARCAAWAVWAAASAPPPRPKWAVF